MQPGELAAWLRLTETPGVGRTSARRLLAAFGDPEAAVAAPCAAVAELIGPAAAQALRSVPPRLDDTVAATRRWCRAADVAPRALIALGDPRYPPRLLETPDPPLLLHAEGNLDLLRAAAVAVVGSRHATPQGLENARGLATRLGAAGLTVVSGLALGIDAAAHEGALRTPASTIAVVANGLDVAYPRRHAALARRIAREGLLLGEHPLGTPPLALHFPQRNRLIAGLALGTLVVEAALRSGSLITARLALECGRDVFAVPGSIHSPLSRGCHALIKQGAKLVEQVEDILDELGWAAPAEAPPAAEEAEAAQGAGTAGTAGRVERTGTAETAPTASTASADGVPAPARAAQEGEDADRAGIDAPPARSPDRDPALHPDFATVPPPAEARLLRALGDDPITLDALLLHLDAPAHEVIAHLLALELSGRVARLPGQRFQRLHTL